MVSICFLFWIELTQRRAATAAAAPHGDKYNKNGQQLMQRDRKGDCDENEADQPASLNLNQGGSSTSARSIGFHSEIIFLRCTHRSAQFPLSKDVCRAQEGMGEEEKLNIY